ncbi:PseG/SpsG family protein [Maridesulfovibrio sp. FT414]|uniref:PseG/SpsG family protein n=1 Tax=Maridesulfovibrio sp. FT414 TaxID=2979469 RepID=UPI003D8060BC
MNKFLFFCEGSPERGFGHVGRCLALAHCLRDEFGQDCGFVFRGSAVARSIIEKDGFPVHEVDEFHHWQFSNTSAVILDLLVPLDSAFFARAKSAGTVLATLDDPTSNRLQCDLAFYPPVPQVTELDWTGFKGELFHDWRFIPLRREFSQNRSAYTDRAVPQLLVSMGGSDPNNLTLLVLKTLKSVNYDWTAKVIAGPMFNDLDKITNLTLELEGKVQLLSNVGNMAELMCDSDLAVASFGMTAYELAACGIPQLLLCISEDHARSASALHQAGAAISLGKFNRVSPDEISKVLGRAINDRELRRKMSDRAAKLNIGNGASNIGAIILERMERKL